MVNEWTRDDLPDDNTHHPRPTVTADLATAERWRDAFRAADAALRQVERERDEDASRLAGVRDAHQRSADAHMKWKARAEAAERELDEARDDDRLHSWGRITRHPFFDSIQFASGELTDAMLAALDEAHQPAPAVPRDEVWRVVAAHDPGDDELAVCRVNRLTDAVCALFGVEAEPADPVTEKARELAGVMHEAIKDERVEWHTAPAAVDAMAARLAAHVLGQESDL